MVISSTSIIKVRHLMASKSASEILPRVTPGDVSGEDQWARPYSESEPDKDGKLGLGGSIYPWGDDSRGEVRLIECESWLDEGLGLSESWEELGSAGCHRRWVLLQGYKGCSDSMEEIAWGIKDSHWFNVASGARVGLRARAHFICLLIETRHILSIGKEK